MFKKCFYFLIFFMFTGCVLMFLACGGASNEPNDKISEATEVELAKSFITKIKPKEDVDWFKVKVPEKGYLSVSASEVPENFKLLTSFALYREWEGKKEEFLRHHKELPAAVAIPEAGTYYIKIEDDYNDQESSKNFKIKVDFIKEMDKFEPNNTPKTAKIIKDGTIVNPAIYPDGDNDWFKIKVEEQGYISVKAKNFPEQITPEVKFVLYDEWSKPKTKELRSWNEIPEACFVPEAGEYYICLHDNYDDNMSTKNFDFRVDFIREIDKYEPNDDFIDAKELTRGDIIEPAIFPRKDNDYFKFTLKENNKVRFVAKNFSSEIVPEVKIYIVNPENPNELKEVTDWKECPAEFELELNKEYYLCLHDNYDDKSEPSTFEFKME